MNEMTQEELFKHIDMQQERMDSLLAASELKPIESVLLRGMVNIFHTLIEKQEAMLGAERVAKMRESIRIGMRKY